MQRSSRLLLRRILLASAVFVSSSLLAIDPATAQTPDSREIIRTIVGGESTVADGMADILKAARSGSWPGEDSLRVGEAFEQTRQWVNAIQVYEAALESDPKNSALAYALRRTRVHFGIDRRYADGSFENHMLSSGRAESLDLLEDVLNRVQSEYVDSISATKFVAHGTESFYMALGNARFLKANGIRPTQKEAVDRVRQTLVRSFWNRGISSRLEARMVVTEVCELAAQELNMGGSSVVMEYLFGGCNALDEYSHFLTPDRYNDLFGSIQGEFVGIGIEMEGEKGRGMHLVNVLLDSPAESGGLRPGDFIVEVDGVNCRDLTTDEAARLLRGPRGSTVDLVFESPDGGLSSAALTRRPVQVRSVTRSLILDDQEGIGYIRMTGFQNSTTEELDSALRKLEREGMKSLIWDLRGNPGGLLDTAAAVIDRFIGDGVLVSTKGRSLDQNQTFRAHNYNTRRIPLVLLIDENSASASEIVAGAINDHKRGQIVGRRTYGKWSVQSIIHLPGGTGLKLTTAKFYSPSDRNYAGRGIDPHVNVPLPENVRRTYFRGRTSNEIRDDPDVARAIELLGRRFTQN